MNIWRRASLIVMLSLLVVPGCGDSSRQDADSRSALVGAWRITETTKTTAGSVSVNRNPQPGLYLFTDRHFSLMLIPGEAPRAVLAEDASTEQRLAAFENFIADAGSYEATDTTLTMQNIIAKLPRAMNGGAGGPYQYSVDGDSLTLTFSGAWARPGKITYRLVRLK